LIMANNNNNFEPLSLWEYGSAAFQFGNKNSDRPARIEYHLRGLQTLLEIYRPGIVILVQIGEKGMQRVKVFEGTGVFNEDGTVNVKSPDLKRLRKKYLGA